MNVIVVCALQISMSNFISRCFQSVADLHGLYLIPQVQTEVNSSSEDMDTQKGNKGKYLNTSLCMMSSS